MDPFAGNNQDPQSLHKYLYAHCNPINGMDPSGQFFGGFSGISIAITITAIVIAVAIVLLVVFYRWVEVDGIKVRYKDASTVRTALTNLKTNEPGMVRFLRGFQGRNLKIKLYKEQNGAYDSLEKTVYWNPRFNNLRVPDVWSQAHPEVILGHELTHAYHHLVERWQGVNPPAIPNAPVRQLVEYRAVGLGPWAGNNFISENTLRQAYNLPIRTSYHSFGNPW